MDIVALRNLIFLSSCVINRQRPCADGMDLDALYRVASYHSLAGIIGYALDYAGVEHEAFRQAKAMAIRRAMILNAERKGILDQLEQAGIWYMPLKGAVMQTYYPQIGMREMSDNDILFDASRAADVRAIMEQRGYTTVIYGSEHRDEYHKPPVSNFEMHRTLFAPPRNKLILTYYQDVKPRLIKNDDDQFGYHFTDEDFYLYMIAHEYKHYTWCGIGVRSLLDTYVFWKRFGQTLDKELLQQRLEQLGLADFERSNRELALALFERIPLTSEQEQMLQYMVLSGTHGTKENEIRNSVQNNGSLIKYTVKRLFPSMNTVKKYHPVFYQHKLLLPFLPLYRLFKKRESVKKEIQILLSMKDKGDGSTKG